MLRVFENSHELISEDIFTVEMLPVIFDYLPLFEDLSLKFNVN